MNPKTATSRLAAFADLSENEAAALAEMVERTIEVGRGRDLRADLGQEPGLFFLQQGWVTSSVELPDHRLQIVKLHLPGDLLGAPSLPFDAPVESLTTLTPTVISLVSLEKLSKLFVRHPRIGTLLYLVAQEERVTLMDRLTAVGRLDARGRLAAFSCTCTIACRQWDRYPET